MKKLVVIFLVLICFDSFSQQDSKIDSLKNLISKTNVDSTKVRLLNEFAWMVRFKDPEMSQKYCNEALTLAQKINNREEESRSYAILGNLNKNKGDMTKALEYYDKARIIREKIGNKKLTAEINNHIGIVYAIQTNYPKTLEHWKKALEIYKEIDNKQGIASILGNIGVVYDNLGDYNTSLGYYIEALKMHEQLPDNESAVAAGLNNIGLIYANIKNYELSLNYHKKALKIREKIQDLNGLGDSYINLGDTYKYLNKLDSSEYYISKSISIKKQIGQKPGIALALLQYGDVLSMLGQYDKAKPILNECLTLHNELGDQFGIALTLQALGTVEMRLNNYSKAQKYYSESLSLFSQIGAKSHVGISYMNMAENEYLMGDYKNAYLKLKKYVFLKDTLINDESTKQIAQMQTIYESEKKQLEIENLNQKNNLNEIFIKQQAKEKYLLILGLLLVVALAAFVYNRLQITRKQRNIISEQKSEVEKAHHELEEKNHEIMQSITYAKRLQQSILPPPRLVKEYMKDSFVLYMPKDIVAGDFYWIESHKNKIYFAAADCTGHGVPGAMVSMVCHNALNRALLEFNLLSPSLILDKASELVDETFSKSEDNVQDGMDVSLYCLDTTTLQLEWAGANNPLWMIQNGEFKEIKADKQPVGRYENRKPFTNHVLQLNEGDSLFSITDGYPDQFGGEQGKKYTYKKLREYLLKISNKPMSLQKDELIAEFDRWKSGHDQVDDVCIIGVKV